LLPWSWSRDRAYLRHLSNTLEKIIYTSRHFQKYIWMYYIKMYHLNKKCISKQWRSKKKIWKGFEGIWEGPACFLEIVTITEMCLKIIEWEYESIQYLMIRAHVTISKLKKKWNIFIIMIRKGLKKKKEVRRQKRLQEKIKIREHNKKIEIIWTWKIEIGYNRCEVMWKMKSVEDVKVCNNKRSVQRQWRWEPEVKIIAKEEKK